MGRMSRWGLRRLGGNDAKRSLLRQKEFGLFALICFGRNGGGIKTMLAIRVRDYCSW